MEGDKVQYGVIHEVGEYSPVKSLSEEDNDIVNKAENSKNDNE